jgi:hypothetical protein
MKNIKLLRANVLLFLISICWFDRLSAQCTPPMAEICDDASVICSLAELNGYSCNNPSIIGSQCSPLCSQGGVGHNTSWWGFVTRGGNVTITVTIGACTTNQGAQFGIWGDCFCGEEVACHSIPCAPPGSVTTINADLVPCKTYYLWVDGCSGDICDFTLNTVGDTSPVLAPLPFINNDTDKIIAPVCVGACNVLFFVVPQPDGCEPAYVWTMDGDEVGGNDNEVRLDFPDQGDFTICVTAYIGNPKSGSVCSQVGPQCTTVKVRPIADRPGVARTICWEQANPGGYKWHSQRIFTSGIYREQFTDANCCKYDSVVEFRVLDKPQASDVFYITCDNEPYVDILGRAHVPCKDHFIINLPKTTDPYRCDSSIRLTAINVEFEPRWRVQCFGGQVEISPNITIIKPCAVGETYLFDYRWYSKNDPNKSTISTDEYLMVDAVHNDYCLEINVRVELETESALCARTFCETFNEVDLAPKDFPLTGDKIVCVNGIESYWIDTFLNTKVLFYNWTIDGGTIISNPDSEWVEIKWLLPKGDTGTVCVFYDTDCGKSPEVCFKVAVTNGYAGRDMNQRGLVAKFNSPSSKAGIWKFISGPGNAIFENPSNPKSRVRVDQFGSYCFEWSVNDADCISKDTVCIKFYDFRFSNTLLKNNVAEDRNYNNADFEIPEVELFTPNLISKTGSSFVSIDDVIDSKIKYSWFDIYGRNVFSEELHTEFEMWRMNIHSPTDAGFYYLVFEIDGIPHVRKVCVIE